MIKKFKIGIVYKNEISEEEFIYSKKDYIKYMKNFDWDYPSNEEFDEWAKNHEKCGVSKIFGYSIFDLIEQTATLQHIVDEYWNYEWSKKWDEIQNIRINESIIIYDDIIIFRLK